jgi:predicted Zn-dependent protease
MRRGRSATPYNFWRVGACLALLTSASCGSERPPDYPFEVTEEDRQIGAEQHPQLVAEFGGIYPGRQADYVNDVGDNIASAAGLDGQCTFTVVNSDVVNAFAVPGCYIYGS